MAATGETAFWIRGVASSKEALARPPWPVTLSALIALLTMALTRRDAVLPVLAAISIIFSQLSSARLKPGSLKTWILRLLIYTGASLVVMANPPPVATTAAVAGQLIDLVMLLGMAELVVQFWQRALLGGTNAVLILLTGFVFVTASKSFVQRFMPWMTPLYVTALIFALHSIRPRAGKVRQSSMAWMRVLLILLALSIGFSSATFIYRYKKKIDRTGFEFVPAIQQAAQKTVGFSSSPVLGEVQSAEKSMTRILRVEGLNQYPRLRGIAFYDYVSGRWDPPAENRGYEALATGELNVKTLGPRLTITRLCEEPQLLFLPLHSAGLQIMQDGSLQRDTRGGSALLFRAPPPLVYSVVLSDTPRYQGPLCIAPDELTMLHCKDVPDTIYPEVWQLAKQIAGGERNPLKKVAAVEDYLQKNNAYSITTDPGAGDPVSNFLLQKKAAHCEYFASAAVILLRCMNIPSRYVTGFYAHESAGARVKIVRAQDAHAWAEAWIEATGWVTLDGTPPLGRPDVSSEPPGFWRKSAEWIMDTANSVLNALSSLSPWQYAGLSAVTVAAIAALFMRQRRAAKGKTVTIVRTAYTRPGEDLGELAAHFDGILYRKQIPCPPNMTWHEHLAAAGGPAPRGLDLEQARAFLNLYNDVRFGRPDDSAAIERLRAMLKVLER